VQYRVHQPAGQLGEDVLRPRVEVRSLRLEGRALLGQQVEEGALRGEGGHCRLLVQVGADHLAVVALDLPLVGDLHGAQAVQLVQPDALGRTPLGPGGQRLLFEAGSVTSIPLGRIVEVGVDAETKYLTVHDDKHREPYYFDVPQPYMALAYVERVLEDGASVRGRDAA